MTLLVERLKSRRDLPPPAVRRALREAAGLSQGDIGRAIGASRQAVAHWEAGRRNPRPAPLAAYVEVLRLLSTGNDASPGHS